MARITSITMAGPDNPIYTGRWIISNQGSPMINKEDDMTNLKMIVVDSHEKNGKSNGGADATNCPRPVSEHDTYTLTKIKND